MYIGFEILSLNFRILVVPDPSCNVPVSVYAVRMTRVGRKSTTKHNPLASSFIHKAISKFYNNNDGSTYSTLYGRTSDRIPQRIIQSNSLRLNFNRRTRWFGQALFNPIFYDFNTTCFFLEMVVPNLRYMRKKLFINFFRLI